MRLAPLLAVLAACATATTKPGDSDTDVADTDVADTDADSDSLSVDTDLPPQGDTGTDTDVAVDTDDTPDPGSDEVVRFVALGDAGEGNTDQYQVAAAIGAVCAVRGCEFALYMGDNFYDGGVYGIDDAQWQSKFELPYADLDFPFHAVLGNHDFGEIPIEFWRTDFQVEYTQHSDKWSMPDHFYAFEQGPAGFIGLDTNMIMLGLDWTQAQRPWVRTQLNRFANKTWRLAYGHHPWKSNGEHGNAGNYEGAWFDPTGLVRGSLIQDFFTQELCGAVDIYLSGHDHNRQWLSPGARCGVDLIVAGAGAKTTGFQHRDNNSTIYEDDGNEGFVWIELNGNVATIAFYDKDGTLDHEGMIIK